jgi:hypothetical protein
VTLTVSTLGGRRLGIVVFSATVIGRDFDTLFKIDLPEVPHDTLIPQLKKLIQSDKASPILSFAGDALSLWISFFN